MATIATSADEHLTGQPTFWDRLWGSVVEFLRIVSLWYLFNKSNWKEKPGIRVRILISFALLWAYLWVPVTFAIDRFWRFMFIFPYFGALVITFVFVAIFLTQGRRRPALNLAFTIAAILLFWFVIVNVPFILFAGPIEPIYMILWGIFWIIASTAVMLFLPIWMIEIKPNEIYYYRDPQVEPEGYRLISRPRPLIDQTIYRALADSRYFTRDELDSFIDFNGPSYMRQQLASKIDPADIAARQNLLQLFRQIDQPSRKPESILWVAAMDKVWLLWNLGDTIWCTVDIRQIITKDGHPVDMSLQFGFSFNPHTIQKPDTRMNLGSVTSRRDLANQLRSKMEIVSGGIAQLYFIDLSLRDALTAGSVRDFGASFVEKMAWTAADGITIKASTVQCKPILHRDVLDAEIGMLASRARALDETARLQALVDKVMLHGVPPQLLAGLLYLDQSTRGDNNTLQVHAPDRDMLGLSDAGQQAARYMYQQFHNNPPGQAIPRMMTDVPRYLDAGRDDDSDVADDNPSRG